MFWYCCFILTVNGIKHCFTVCHPRPFVINPVNNNLIYVNTVKEYENHGFPCDHRFLSVSSHKSTEKNVTTVHLFLANHPLFLCVQLSTIFQLILLHIPEPIVWIFTCFEPSHLQTTPTKSHWCLHFHFSLTAISLTHYFSHIFYFQLGC